MVEVTAAVWGAAMLQPFLLSCSPCTPPLRVMGRRMTRLRGALTYCGMRRGVKGVMLMMMDDDAATTCTTTAGTDTTVVTIVTMVIAAGAAAEVDPAESTAATRTGERALPAMALALMGRVLVTGGKGNGGAVIRSLLLLLLLMS